MESANKGFPIIFNFELCPIHVWYRKEDQSLDYGHWMLRWVLASIRALGMLICVCLSLKPWALARAKNMFIVSIGLTICLSSKLCNNYSIKSGQSILIYFTYTQNIIISKVGTTENFAT